MKLSKIIKNKISRQYFFGGIYFVIQGTVIFFNPVMNTYKFQYDLRGIPKWIVLLLSLTAGLYFISKSFNKKALALHICSTCDYQEMLFVDENYACPYCGKSLELKT